MHSPSSVWHVAVRAGVAGGAASGVPDRARLVADATSAGVHPTRAVAGFARTGSSHRHRLGGSRTRPDARRSVPAPRG
jgi:hypothetical protein